MVEYFKQLKDGTFRAATDVYVFMFLADIVTFLIAIFGFSSFGPAVSHDDDDDDDGGGDDGDDDDDDDGGGGGDDDYFGGGDDDDECSSIIPRIPPYPVSW